MRREYDEEKLHSHIRDNHLENYMSADISTILEPPLLDKNDYLVQIGYPAGYLCFLVNEEVITPLCSANDKSACISYCRQSTTIGEAASLWRMVPCRSVKALTRCTYIGVNLIKHRQTLLNDFLSLQNICQISTYRLNSENELSQILSEPLEVRLSRFVLIYSVNQIFTFQLADCVDTLNTSYRYLSRMLRCFCVMGVLEKARNCYVIVDRKRLGEIVNGTLVIGNPQGGEPVS